MPTNSDPAVTPPAVPPPAVPADVRTRIRAAALPPAERRADIVAAVLPLVMAHGTGLTTRQIAEAAGVAEGTLFRVFDDKDALIDAVIDAALDPAPTERALSGIDPSAPLETRLVEAVEILRRRMANVFQLMGMLQVCGDRHQMSQRRKLPGLDVLAGVFEPDRAQLRRDPLSAAQLLRGLTLAGTHPTLILDEPMSSEEIVSLLLDGIRVRASPGASP